MSAAPSYAPLNETSRMLLVESSTIIENQMECTFYGLALMLYLFTAHSMYRAGLKRNWPLLAFISAQLICMTIGVVGNSRFLILSFVYNRSYPGGILDYRRVFSNNPVSYLGLIGPMMSTWMQDVLLLYRFYIIFSGYIWVFMLPVVMFLVSLGFSVLLLVQVAASGGAINVAEDIPVALIYFSLTVGLNFLVTTLIVARILRYKQQIGISLGTEHARIYTSIGCMFIESAALVTISGLTLIIAIPTSPAGSNILAGIYGMSTVIAPTLIAYRVCHGRAWTRETSNTSPGTIQFADRRSFGEPYKTHTMSTPIVSRGFTNATTDVESIASEEVLETPVDPNGSRPDLNKYV